mgnify:CR=1 FL=1
MSNDNFRNKNILSDLLISVGQDLRNAFERSINIKHHGERGRIREERVLSFLIERLPKKNIRGQEKYQGSSLER